MTIELILQGYNRHFRSSPFTEPWEPLYSRVLDEQVQLGTVVLKAHCNSRGLVQGAFLAALLDNAMGLSAGVMLESNGYEGANLVTVDLSVSYIGRAELGSWINTDVSQVQTTGSMVFLQSRVVSDGRSIAHASATFRVLKSVS